MRLNLLVRGREVEASLELDGARTVCFGRSRRCDLVVTDPTVSRFHAEMRMESQSIVLRDLDSTNGTFVNDVRAASQAVSPGDRIRLGSAELILFLARSLVPSVPRPGGEILSGIADALSPVDLVQVLAAQGKTGTLMLYKGTFGRIDLRNGQVCFAKVGGVEGEKAFHRILGWTGAEFQFRGAQPRQTNLELPTRRLLVEHVQHQEEMKALQQALPGPETELSVERTRTSGVRLSPLENEVLRAASHARTMAALMDANPSPDIEVARAVARLMDLGVLLPQSPRGDSAS